MKKSHLFFLILGMLGACQSQPKQPSLEENSASQNPKPNLELAKEIHEMKDRDQEAMFNSFNENGQMILDSILQANCERAKEIIETEGFPGYDLLGEEGAQDFWLIVQHSDHDLAFQEKFLEMMKPEVKKGNSSGKNYAFLVDRVRMNEGQKQLYGTQLEYRKNGQAFPQALEDSLGVDQRRKEMGLESLKAYLNKATKVQFDMNQDHYQKMGIQAPILYEVESSE